MSYELPLATTAKKVPPMPKAKPGTKLAKRMAVQNCMAIISRAAAAIRAEGGQADALHLLGVVRIMNGQAGEAIELLGRALEAKADDVGILENLGLAHLVAQEIGTAEVILRRAVALGASNGLTYMRLGMALGFLGRMAEAVEMLQTAAAKLPVRAMVSIMASASGVRARRLSAAVGMHSVYLNDVLSAGRSMGRGVRPTLTPSQHAQARSPACNRNSSSPVTAAMPTTAG